MKAQNSQFFFNSPEKISIKLTNQKAKNLVFCSLNSYASGTTSRGCLTFKVFSAIF